MSLASQSSPNTSSASRQSMLMKSSRSPSRRASTCGSRSAVSSSVAASARAITGAAARSCPVCCFSSMRVMWSSSSRSRNAGSVGSPIAAAITRGAMPSANSVPSSAWPRAAKRSICEWIVGRIIDSRQRLSTRGENACIHHRCCRA